MSGGTFNIARSIWDSDAFAPSEFSEREAFIWLISEASWKPRKKTVGKFWVDLKRGQLCASVRFLADAWGWSKSRVSRFLLRLKNRDMVQTENGTAALVITICNYDEYQNAPGDGGTAMGQPAGQQRDSDGTNYKKGDNKGKKDNITPASVFAPVLGEELARDVIDHRKKIGKPLTARAAELLLAQFEQCGDPPAGAEMMIAQGWQGFKASWFNNDRPNGKASANGKLDRIMRLADRLDGQPPALGKMDSGAGAGVALPLLPARAAGGDR